MPPTSLYCTIDFNLASSSLDEVNITPVVDQLKRRGYESILFEPDAIAHNVRPFSVEVTADGALHCMYDGSS